MNTDHIPEDLLNKLNKLRNLAEGAAAVSSAAESANAAGKYQELLLKYNLSDEQVTQAGIKAKIQMMDSVVVEEEVWMHYLMNAVIRSCMCQPLLDNIQGKKVYHILGEKHNVAVAEYMIEQLVRKSLVAFEVEWYQNRKWVKEPKAVYRKSFLMGCGDAIIAKLHDQEKAMTAAKENTGMELMIINKRALATRFMHDKYPNTQRVGSRINKGASRNGYESGKEAGRGINVDKGLGHVDRGQIKKLGQ